MEAEGTLVGVAMFLVNVSGIIRTGSDTGLAANTFVMIYQDNAVFTLV